MFQSTGLVLTFDEFRKRGVTLNYMRRVQRYIELLTDFRHTLCLMFSTAIREEDERNALVL